MRIATTLLVLLLCASCSLLDVKKTKVPPSASSIQAFVGEWKRGQPSADGTYSERVVIKQKTFELYEDGKLVLTGAPVIDGEKLIIEPLTNTSKYYGNLGGCWARLRSDNTWLELFGKVKGELDFDRMPQNKGFHGTR
jgi:hypothetical protein